MYRDAKDTSGDRKLVTDLYNVTSIAPLFGPLDIGAELASPNRVGLQIDARTGIARACVVGFAYDRREDEQRVAYYKLLFGLTVDDVGDLLPAFAPVWLSQGITEWEARIPVIAATLGLRRWLEARWSWTSAEEDSGVMIWRRMGGPIVEVERARTKLAVGKVHPDRRPDRTTLKETSNDGNRRTQ